MPLISALLGLTEGSIAICQIDTPIVSRTIYIAKWQAQSLNP
jgi:hypothetical protein